MYTAITTEKFDGRWMLEVVPGEITPASDRDVRGYYTGGTRSEAIRMAADAEFSWRGLAIEERPGGYRVVSAYAGP